MEQELYTAAGKDSTYKASTKDSLNYGENKTMISYFHVYMKLVDPKTQMLLAHLGSKLLHWIWRLKLLSKIKFFVWLVIRNAFSICDFMHAKRLEFEIDVFYAILKISIMSLKNVLLLQVFEIG